MARKSPWIAMLQKKSVMKKAKIQVTITTNELSEATKEEMWQVYHKYYHYSREYFMQRIHRNNYFSFYTIDGRIIGFTGLRINRTEVHDKECLMIYFGQTIIDQKYRGKALIPRTAVKLFLKYWKDLIRGRIYVWADALTYKAYLVFAKTLKEYYPTYRTVMPAHVKALINFVGDEYYGETFCRDTGTVQKDTVFVNDPTTRIDPRQETDQDVLFYAQSNPDYINGHGLITLAPMTGENYLYLIWKCIRKNLIGSKKGEDKQPKVLLTKPD
jgi:RimJ/RimL family protein N-acetyltransferase